MFKKHLPLLKNLLGHREFTVTWAAFILVALIVAVTAAVHVVPRDLQLYVHYTSFGVTKFYTDNWFYLIVFVVFALLLLVGHTLISAKIYNEKGKYFAVLFMALSIAVGLITELLISGLYHLISINVG